MSAHPQHALKRLKQLQACSERACAFAIRPQRTTTKSQAPRH
jgi:hypothetical protein